MPDANAGEQLLCGEAKGIASRERSLEKLDRRTLMNLPQLQIAATPARVADPSAGDRSVSGLFFSNTILNYVGQGLILILTLATTPYTVRRLGPELFGIVALVQVIAGFGSLLNLGIGRALTKYVSELYWKGEFQTIGQLFQTAWATCLVAGLIGLIVLIVPRQLIGGLFFRGGPDVDAVASFAIYLAALGLFTTMLLEAISSLPIAVQRFGVLNAINVMVGAVRCLGPVAVLACGYSIRAVLVVILASNLLAVGAFAFASKSFIPGLSFVPRFSSSAFRRLLSLSLPLFLSAIFSLIVAKVDRLILAYYLPLAAVTYYTLPSLISDKASASAANITSVVFPFTSELHSMGAHDKIHELYLRSTKILTLITLPFTVILLSLPGPILQLWLGSEYAEQGAVVLRALGAATFLSAISGVATVTSLGVGQAWVPAIFAFSSSGVTLLANLVLVPAYGINGAAFAALVPQMLVVPLFVFTITRMIGASHWELVSHGFLRPLICATVQLAMLFYFRPYANSLGNLAILCIVSLCTYGALSLFWATTQQERAALLRLLPSVDRLKFARLG
ncbi:flippase [Bradyrhizobium canariense]|uniref:flippase n=1 Tax=Bradyrhizobium canariense TaxID=255045 RepID=UPI001C678C00|nr:flippase [Bradyrhizobium canariense]MBW5438029.1 flippase [Bradyrhizobium canariense]